MACNKKNRPAFIACICLFTLVSFIACVSGCSSADGRSASENADVPELSATEDADEASLLESVETRRELTLPELTAVLDAAWLNSAAADSASKPAAVTAASASSATAASQEPLYTAPAALPAGDRLSRKYQTALGSFIADAERGFLFEHGIATDFAFINAELIRAGLPEGPVSKQDIERVLPFGQKIVVAEMRGTELLELFAFIGALPQGAGGFAQVSSGVSYTLTFDETGFSPELSNLLIEGSVVDEERVYRVALNDFVAAGGSGYSFFLRDDVLKAETCVGLAEAVADYCTRHADALYMNQGERITIIGGIIE